MRQLRSETTTDAMLNLITHTHAYRDFFEEFVYLISFRILPRSASNTSNDDDDKKQQWAESESN